MLVIPYPAQYSNMSKLIAMNSAHLHPGEGSPKLQSQAWDPHHIFNGITKVTFASSQ